jgi:oxaloacetate decarboxylase gamma subunit
MQLRRRLVWCRGLEMNLLLQSGLELMVIGMGTVFLFLGLLVAVTLAMSALVNKIAPEHTILDSSGTAPVMNEHLLAVLQEAVRQHRARKSKY